jgi:histidinol-phosphate/aromatic aminotransferase/cobyric acid decarboxylase-like protein
LNKPTKFSRPLWTKDFQRQRDLFWLDKNEITLESAFNFNQTIINKLQPIDLSVYPDLGKTYIYLEKIFGINEENSLFVNGADGGIREVFISFSEYYQAVIFDPTFAMISVYPNNLNNNFIQVNYEFVNNKLLIDKDKLFKALSSTNKPPLLVIASPDSPTGSVLKIEELKQLLKTVESLRGILLFDGTYSLYKGYEYMLEVISIIKKSSSALFTTSFSKSPGLAGLRLGFLTGSLSQINQIRSLRPMYEIGAVQSKILEYVLNEWETCLETIYEINQNKSNLEGILKDYGCKIIPTFGNFTLFKSTRDVEKALEDLCYYRKNFKSDCLKDLSRVSSPPNLFISKFKDLMSK